MFLLYVNITYIPYIIILIMNNEYEYECYIFIIKYK